jgi:hypothetical protein
MNGPTHPTPLGTQNARLTVTVVREPDSTPLPEVWVDAETVGQDAPVRAGGETDLNGRTRLADLPPGEYRLLVFNAEQMRLRLGQGEEKQVTLTLDAGRLSRLAGQVVDSQGTPQAGLAVNLYQLVPHHLLAETVTDAQGRYQFSQLPRAKVQIWVAPGTSQATQRGGLRLDGWSAVEANLTVAEAAPRYRVTAQRLLSVEETGNDNKIFGQVLAMNGTPQDGITVRLRWTGAGPETQFPTVRTGQDPFKPRGYFEFIHTPGTFMVDLIHPDYASDSAADLHTADSPARSRPISYEVTFQLQTPAPPPPQSVVQGWIEGSPPNLVVTLLGSGNPRATRLDGQGRFRFGELPPGLYQISLEGIGLIREGISLDGTNRVEVEFPMLGRIQGQVEPAQPTATLLLTCERYSLRLEDETDDQGRYEFSNLPADRYTLRLQGSDQPGVELLSDGRSLISGPTFSQAPPPPPQPQGEITGRVLSSSGQPAAGRTVHLAPAGQWPRTSGEDGRFHFQHLPPATYTVSLADAPKVAESVTVTEGSPAQVTLRLPPLPVEAARPLAHYLCLTSEDPDLRAAQLGVAAAYVQRSFPTVGFDPAGCSRAQAVTLIGEPPPGLVDELQAAGIPVEQLSGQLDRLATELEQMP